MVIIKVLTLLYRKRNDFILMLYSMQAEKWAANLLEIRNFHENILCYWLPWKHWGVTELAQCDNKIPKV